MAGYIVIEKEKYAIPDKMKLKEARLIKQISGVGMAEIGTALERGDPDLLAALVLIVMRRSGRRIELEQVDELDVTEINFENDPEDTDPPAVAAVEAAPVNGNQVTIPSPSGTPPTATTSA